MPEAELVEVVLTDLAAALDCVTRLQARIDKALALSDEQLGCTDWCLGEHCLYVIKTYREALGCGG